MISPENIHQRVATHQAEKNIGFTPDGKTRVFVHPPTGGPYVSIRESFESSEIRREEPTKKDILNSTSIGPERNVDRFRRVRIHEDAPVISSDQEFDSSSRRPSQVDAPLDMSDRAQRDSYLMDHQVPQSELQGSWTRFAVAQNGEWYRRIPNKHDEAGTGLKYTFRSVQQQETIVRPIDSNNKDAGMERATATFSATNGPPVISEWVAAAPRAERTPPAPEGKEDTIESITNALDALVMRVHVDAVAFPNPTEILAVCTALQARIDALDQKLDNTVANKNHVINMNLLITGIQVRVHNYMTGHLKPVAQLEDETRELRTGVNEAETVKEDLLQKIANTQDKAQRQLFLRQAGRLAYHQHHARKHTEQIA